MLVDFVYNLRVERKRERLIEGGDWDTLLSEAGVIETVESIEDRDSRPGTLLIREDRTFYRFRGSPNMLARIRDDWYEFHAVEEGARKAIFEALVEAHEGRPSMLLRYIDLPVEEYLDRFRRDAIGEAEPQ